MRSLHLITLAALCAGALQAADYQLPFAGTWFTAQAGDTLNVNHHMSLRSQWFGIDFVKVGGEGGRRLEKTDGHTVEDYYGWGAEVLAPVDGVVLEMENSREDNPMGQTDKVNVFGNFVKIKVGEREYAVLCHFQKGSVLVKAGGAVKRGQLLGKCGNSGNTTMPHIHLHVQNEAGANAGAGLNITFKAINVLLSGKAFSNVDWPLIRGLFVSNAATSP